MRVNSVHPGMIETGMQDVARRDNPEGFKAIVDGECDQYPEQAFYMVGAIEEVAAKAQKIAAETAKAA